MKETYKQLTGIDINEQMQIWDERAKGYYGEYLVFCELYSRLSGNGKILMNLNIPTDNESTTEIDLILIHETGLYIFEIKHFKGTIYGKEKDEIWTQYFKTSENKTFKNPILQNEYHIKALKKIFPNIPMNSFIVFTNNESTVKVEVTSEDIEICALKDLVWTLYNKTQTKTQRFNMEQINNIFSKLSVYSQMQEKAEIGGKEASFLSWIQPTIDFFANAKSEMEKEKAKWIGYQEELKLQKKKEKIKGAVAIILCVCVSFAACFLFVERNNKRVEQLEQKFLHIEEIDNKYINELTSYVEVTNAALKPISNDAISFTARIAVKTEEYGIKLTKNSTYIVMTEDGNVFEYNVFGEHLRYNVTSYTLSKRQKEYGDLAKANFFGISDISKVSYIKITGIEMFKTDITRTKVKDGLEIELYSK